MTRLCAGIAFVTLAAGCGGGANASDTSTPEDPVPTRSAPAPTGEKPDLAQLKRVMAEARYHADLGAVHLNHRRNTEAIAAYRQAIEVARGLNEDALHFWALGKAYRAAGNDIEYRKNLAYAAKLLAGFVADKSPVRARNHDHYCERLAQLYGELGDMPKAVEWIDQMGTVGEPSTGTLRAKARLYIASGLGAKALGVLEQAERQAQPGIQKQRASYTLAEVLLNMRRHDEALARVRPLQQSAAEPGLRVEAKKLVFRIYEAMGKLDELKLGNDAPTPDAPGGGK